MRRYLRKLLWPSFLAAFFLTLVPVLASASGSGTKHIELAYSGPVAPSDILCEDVEACRRLGDICTDNDCILAFQVKIPLRGGGSVLMTEYVHSEVPVNPEMTTSYVDCTRTFKFPGGGSLTARYDTLFKSDNVIGNLVYARAASLGYVTGGTGYLANASGFASVSGDGAFDLNTPQCNPVELNLEIEFDLGR